MVQATVKSGVVSEVLLSVLEEPESVAAVMSGVPVPVGAVASMVAVRESDDADALPAVSV